MTTVVLSIVHYIGAKPIFQSIAYNGYIPRKGEKVRIDTLWYEVINVLWDYINNKLSNVVIIVSPNGEL